MMRIFINVLLTPVVLVLCIPIAVFVALFYFFKFPIDMIVSVWEGN